MANETPAGWYPAPDASDLLRYWDGEMWTEQARPAPVRQAGPNRGVTGKPTLKVQRAQVVLDVLEPDERIEAGFASLVFRNTYFVATASRVLVIEPVGLRKHEVHSFGYQEIDSIGMARTGALAIHVGEERYLGATASGAMEDFLTFVRNRQPRAGSIDLTTLPTPTVEAEAKDGEPTEDDTLGEQILKLAELHANGVLSDQEFLDAKASLFPS